MPQKKRAQDPSKRESLVIELVINLITRFGIRGTFFVLLMAYSTKEQWREFIDTFILWKFARGDTFFPGFILFYVLLACGARIYFLTQQLRISRERIKILENELMAEKWGTANPIAI